MFCACESKVGSQLLSRNCGILRNVLSLSGLLLADRKQLNVTDSGSVDAVERDTKLLWYAKQQLVHILLEL